MSRVRNCSQKEMAVASAAPRYPNPAPQEAVRARTKGGGVLVGGRRGVLVGEGVGGGGGVD